MLKNLLVIKLVDDTIIYAKEHEIKSGQIVIKGVKYKRDGEITKYVDDEMTISMDAVRVYFSVLTGGKAKEEVQGSPRPTEPIPAA